LKIEEGEGVKGITRNWWNHDHPFSLQSYTTTCS